MWQHFKRNHRISSNYQISENISFYFKLLQYFLLENENQSIPEQNAFEKFGNSRLPIRHRAT